MATVADLIRIVKSDITSGKAQVKVGGEDPLTGETKLYAIFRRGDIYEPSYYLVEANKMMNDRYSSLMWSMMKDSDERNVMFNLNQAQSKDMFNFMNGKRSSVSNAEKVANADYFVNNEWNDNPHA